MLAPPRLRRGRPCRRTDRRVGALQRPPALGRLAIFPPNNVSASWRACYIKDTSPRKFHIIFYLIFPKHVNRMSPSCNRFVHLTGGQSVGQSETKKPRNPIFRIAWLFFLIYEATAFQSLPVESSPPAQSRSRHRQAQAPSKSESLYGYGPASL